MSDFMFDRNTQIVFDEAYRASLPPQVAALLDISDSVARMATAQGLAAAGFIIDVPIQVWGWNPYATMAYRLIDGFTWVPNALQPSVGYDVGQASAGPPYVPYDPSKPPASSIRVSVNPADFPPYIPPAPKPDLPAPGAAKFVGELSFGNTYKAGPGTVINGNSVNVFDGEEKPQDGFVYIAKVSHGLFGIVVLYNRK